MNKVYFPIRQKLLKLIAYSAYERAIKRLFLISYSSAQLIDIDNCKGGIITSHLKE